jgi:hypothetical protein
MTRRGEGLYGLHSSPQTGFPSEGSFPLLVARAGDHKGPPIHIPAIPVPQTGFPRPYGS